MNIQFKVLAVPVMAIGLVAGTFIHNGLAKESARRSSQDNFFKLGVALLQYSDDYEGKLPPMQNALTAKKSLQGFVEDAALIQPATKRFYVPNWALSGQKHADFNDQKVVAFYEAQPSVDGKRWVLFVPPFDPKVVHFEHNSGFVKDYVKHLSKNEWLKLKLPTVKP